MTMLLIAFSLNVYNTHFWISKFGGYESNVQNTVSGTFISLLLYQHSHLTLSIAAWFGYVENNEIKRQFSLYYLCPTILIRFVLTFPLSLS